MRKRRARRAIVVLGASLLCILALLGARSSTIGADIRGAATEVAASELQDTATNAGALGVYLSEDAVVVVLPTGVHIDVATLAGNDGQTKVETKAVDVTAADVAAVKELVARTHASRGGSWAAWFDPVRGSIVVEGPEDPSLDAVLRAEFGTKVTRVLADHSFVRLLGRNDDTPPFWGGAMVQDDPLVSRCSTGFSVTRGGVSYILTAGHCWTLNRRIETPPGTVRRHRPPASTIPSDRF